MTKTAAVSRDAVEAAQDLESEEVDVPEWGGIVYVRGLTAAERDDFEASCLISPGKQQTLNLKNMRAKLVVLSVVDEHGERIFSDADAEMLGGKCAAVVDRLFSIAQRLSGLSDTDVEELTKNSPRGRLDTSVTGSVATSESGMSMP